MVTRPHTMMDTHFELTLAREAGALVVGPTRGESLVLEGHGLVLEV